MPNAATLDRRICVRLPQPLVERLNKECKTTATRISDVVRVSLAEHFSPKTEPEQCR